MSSWCWIGAKGGKLLKETNEYRSKYDFDSTLEDLLSVCSSCSNGKKRVLHDRPECILWMFLATSYKYMEKETYLTVLTVDSRKTKHVRAVKINLLNDSENYCYFETKCLHLQQASAKQYVRWQYCKGMKRMEKYKLLVEKSFQLNKHAQ